MKFLPTSVILPLFFISSNALSDEFLEKFVENVQNTAQSCAEETHASGDDITEIIEGNTPNTHEGKCLIFCIQKKMHLMHEDGTLDKYGSILALDDLRQDDFELYKKVLKVFVNCSDKVQILDDPCETGTDLMKCAKDEAEAMGLDSSIIG